MSLCASIYLSAHYAYTICNHLKFKHRLRGGKKLPLSDSSNVMEVNFYV